MIIRDNSLWHYTNNMHFSISDFFLAIQRDVTIVKDNNINNQQNENWEKHEKHANIWHLYFSTWKKHVQYRIILGYHNINTYSYRDTMESHGMKWYIFWRERIKLNGDEGFLLPPIMRNTHTVPKRGKNAKLRIKMRNKWVNPIINHP